MERLRERGIHGSMDFQRKSGALSSPNQRLIPRLRSPWEGRTGTREAARVVSSLHFHLVVDGPGCLFYFPHASFGVALQPRI